MRISRIAFEPQDNGDYWEVHYEAATDSDGNPAEVEVARHYAAALQARRDGDGWQLYDHTGEPVAYTGAHGGRDYVDGRAPHVPDAAEIEAALAPHAAAIIMWRALQVEAENRNEKERAAVAGRAVAEHWRVAARLMDQHPGGAA